MLGWINFKEKALLTPTRIPSLRVMLLMLFLALLPSLCTTLHALVSSCKLNLQIHESRLSSPYIALSFFTSLCTELFAQHIHLYFFYIYIGLSYVMFFLQFFQPLVLEVIIYWNQG